MANLSSGQPMLFLKFPFKMQMQSMSKVYSLLELRFLVKLGEVKAASGRGS